MELKEEQRVAKENAKLQEKWMAEMESAKQARLKEVIKMEEEKL